MNFEERTNLIKNLQMVDQVLSFEDDELGSSNCCIEKILSLTGSNTKIIVANGGDRNPSNIPEVIKYGDHPRVEFAWGVGGDDKKNSSSWILKSWNQPTTERPWGRYTVLNKGNGWQVKQLEFDSGKSLSNQRHFKRSEHWHVVEGIIQMTLEKPDGTVSIVVKGPGESIDIPKLTWHKSTNIGNATARVIEVWMGTELTENDIERRNQ
jgi:mannose-6-phosphate isomerase-like protein (cupin superfamily)